MATYELIYDYQPDDSDDEIQNIMERFEGTFDELQEQIEYLKSVGAYHFSVTELYSW